MFRRQRHLPYTLVDPVIIIGCGGVGFWVAYTFAMLGQTSAMILCDPDNLDITNLNRIPVSKEEVGRNKAEVLADTIRKIRPDILVYPVKEAITKRNLVEVLMLGDIYTMIKQYTKEYVTKYGEVDEVRGELKSLLGRDPEFEDPNTLAALHDVSHITLQSCLGLPVAGYGAKEYAYSIVGVFDCTDNPSSQTALFHEFRYLKDVFKYNPRRSSVGFAWRKISAEDRKAAIIRYPEYMVTPNFNPGYQTQRVSVLEAMLAGLMAVSEFIPQGDHTTRYARYADLQKQLKKEDSWQPGMDTYKTVHALHRLPRRKK